LRESEGRADADGETGVDGETDVAAAALRRAACARLSLGDARRARALARGGELRGHAERFARAVLGGAVAERPWLQLLALAKDEAARVGEEQAERVVQELELLPPKERKRHQREALEAQRRSERRARTRALDGGLQLMELWLRDVWCTVEGAEGLIYNRDRAAELREDAAGRSPKALQAGIGLVCDTRMRMTSNVSEELALEALAYRLADVLVRPHAAGHPEAGV
jgi:hypothetical protein